jgi:hypothetical protein
MADRPRLMETMGASNVSSTSSRCPQRTVSEDSSLIQFLMPVHWGALGRTRSVVVHDGSLPPGGGSGVKKSGAKADMVGGRRVLGRRGACRPRLQSARTGARGRQGSRPCGARGISWHRPPATTANTSMEPLLHAGHQASKEASGTCWSSRSGSPEWSTAVSRAALARPWLGPVPRM